jgi:ParB family chromosome partitioning protein
MVKKRGLNRGLEALLQGAGSLDVDLTQNQPLAKDGLQELPVEWVQRGVYQPRRDLDPEALEELAASIRVHGIMQPIVVRSVGIDRYEIIAGERRWRAAQLAELDSVPALIKEVPDEAAIAMALIENIQREDLNAMEEAFALQRLQNEFELTQQQVADAVGKSRSAIANLLRLLQLSEAVRLMLERGDLEMGHARCLLPLDEAQQLQLAREVVAKGLSVRQTEELVRKAQQIPKPTEAKADDADINHLQNRLSNAIGAAVTIKQSAKGKGKMTISYATLDQLDGIIARLEP